MKKKIIILLIVLIVLLSGFITFMIILNNKKEEVIEEPIVKAEELNIVLKENLSVEFLKEVRVSDFIESINYELVDDFVIDTMDIGKKEVVFEVMDSNNKRIRSSFDINIIDVTGPTIWLSGSYTVMEGANIDLAKAIMCIDDTDDNPTTSVEGYYDLDSAGSYPLVYKASDKYGNTSEEYFNLYVIDYTTTPYNGEPLSFDYVLNTYKNDNTMIGLDISSWQGTIDFDKIKDAGVEFVFIRIGSEDNEGRFIDSKFERNYEEAKRVGLKVGVYYYSYAESEE